MRYILGFCLCLLLLAGCQEEDAAPAIIEPPAQTHTGPAITYTIDQAGLQVTTNSGEDWTKVPVEVDELFEGEYQGSKTELIDQSYVLAEDRFAFIIGGFEQTAVLSSTDQGKTWETAELPDAIEGVRLRIIGFTSEQDGFVILSGGRTMSTEGNQVYHTTDGGKTWTLAGGAPSGRIVQTGTFVSKDMGFMTFGSTGPTEYYRTTDGGSNWDQFEVVLPGIYRDVFTVMESAEFNDDQIVMTMGQGTNGDYYGGNVKATLVSDDKGHTFEMTGLIDPDDVMTEEEEANWRENDSYY
ncbi:BNR/Asp-box repeat-containing protein [Terribacillus halophilus]|uniref:BNR/Asp-box repeat-containing protein n=1 Tax=Terribacillus halophilus TaxID=361279 RepID=A0A1G6U2Q0_9BACI|nr:sialidase family protein [Terribacillus halophilus]SDD35670.1 BNR/Asp-box repeat-containing protein [Terribacillus halophilus]